MWAVSPEPLSRLQKTTVAALTVLTALSRLAAISREPWEWDEILFSTAVREFDVAVHHPHPPGFPLFIAAAKLLSLAGLSDFHALQAVVVAGSMFIFPLVFALGRELRLGFGVSVGGALITAYALNVWYYGGTAFSDVPGLAIVLAASVFLLRGPRSVRALLAGALLLGIAIAFRPQLVLIAAIPLAIAVYHRRRMAIPAMLIVVIIPVLSYGGAAAASSSAAGYADAVRKQQSYVSRVDSFRSPTRPSLLSLTRTFFKPTRGGAVADKLIPLIAALGLAGALLRRQTGAIVLAAMFGPLAIFSWLMLDLNAASRYAVAYVPMFALLASSGVDLIARRREWITVSVCAAVAIWFAVNGWVPLQRVRWEEPPVVRAIRSLPPAARVYATPGVVPFASYYREGDVIDVSGSDVGEDGYLVVDALSSSPCAQNYLRERGRLADIARARYFEASVVPLRCVSR
ncbi:MAG TPA: hypothetical protein VFT12_11545 [Thermoanaerobaculia bacterium]|nr:hypothetical protein [Thermoanaerobaculia bacterium]